MSEYQVQSPLPGTFYRKPSPESAPFVEEGAKVEVGSVIGMVEIMKQFSEIHAEQAGTLQSFHVADSEPVDAGQVIATITE